MIRLTPTTIALTMDEVKDFEVRRRYRNYLSQQGKCPKDVQEAQEVGGKAVTDRVPSAGSAKAGPSKLDTPPAPGHRSPLAKSPPQTAAGPALDEQAATVADLESFATQGQAPATEPSTPTRALALPPRRPPRTNSSPPDMYTTDGFVDSRRPVRSSPTAVLFSETELGVSMPGSGVDLHEHNRDAGPTSTQSPDSQIEETPRRFRLRRSPATPPNRGQEAVEVDVDLAQEEQGQTSKGAREPEQSSSASRPSRRMLTRSATKLIEARNRLLADETGGTASTSPDHGVLRRNRHHTAMLSSSPAQSSSVAQGSSMGQSSSTLHGSTAEESGASGFHIYDDSQPASSQPQTPQNLPEARHRSRILPAYTAPASSTASRNRHSRRRAIFARSRSPEGLETPGFRGLFGGTENRDEATLFEEALQRITEMRGEGSPRTDQEE